MVRAKNYETASKFIKGMRRKLYSFILDMMYKYMKNRS